MTERVLTARITRAGMRAIFAANNQGLDLDLTHIAIGTGGGSGYTPNGNETALMSEFERVQIGGGDYLSDFEILVEGLLTGTPAGWVNEIGVFTSAGVLFAVWSEPNAPLAYKTANVPLVLGLTLAVGDVPPGSLNIVVGAPSVNITIAGPFSALAAELIRLQRRATETETERVLPIIQNTWYT